MAASEVVAAALAVQLPNKYRQYRHPAIGRCNCRVELTSWLVVDGEGRLFEALPDEGISRAERRQIEHDQAKWWIEYARAELHQSRDYLSRQPCRDCNTTKALLVPLNGQNVVHCARCGRSLYNAPKTETGQRHRTVATLRRAIKPSQQARILDRDHRACVLCGRSDVLLVIGHLLSVEEGAALGASEIELYDDANLAAMCEACNLGLGRHSISTRTYAVIMLHLVRTERGRNRRADAVTQGESLAKQAGVTSVDVEG